VSLGRSDRGALSFVDGAGPDSAGADPKVALQGAAVDRVGVGWATARICHGAKPTPAVARPWVTAIAAQVEP